ncbi:MAG: sigma-54-dependent Fis family transcriptional regulator [Actinomycetota bacterium]
MARTTHDDEPLIALARAEFLDGTGDRRPNGVAEHVVASWQRCASRGVPSSVVDSPYFDDLDVGSRLVRCAEPVIDRLVAELSDIPMCVALTDSQARLLTRKDATRSFGRVTDRVCFAQGFGYAEGAVGTNGVGTVLEAGHSVHIVGAEHYLESLQSFACAGAPVRDPFSGRVEGVLDISCLATHSSPILHSLVRTAASAIEQALVADRNEANQALFDLYSRIDARTRDGVFAIGPELTVVNTRLSALLDSTERDALQDHVRFLMHRHSVVDDAVALPSGLSVRLRASTVVVGCTVAGMVGVVTPTEPPGPGPRRTRPATAVGHRAALPGTRLAHSTSAAWDGAAQTVRAALHDREPVVVIGEPGSGRFSLIENEFRGTCPEGEVVGITPAEVRADVESVVRRLAADDAPDVLHVLRDLDQLPDAVAARLTDLLARLDTPAPVVATSAGEHRNRSASHLWSLFTSSATVPALRHRRADLPSLVSTLLDELAPHREVRLSREADRTIASFDWPGNVRQLREALQTALHARPVGTINVLDLPPYCQSVPRVPLRPVDEAERDAVVTALRAVGGNRKAAARTLGLARSTLYRKIKQYGITD